VLNDLQAQGYALGHIAPDQLTTLKSGKVAPQNATMLVVGVGTGFNCAPVFHDGANRLVPPSEAGHVTLAARGKDQVDLVDFLNNDLGHTAVEDVLSGRGLEHCYRWAAGRNGTQKTATTTEVFAAAQAQDRVALQAIEGFIKALGGVVGDLALTVLPFGGIYLVGGMSRAIAPFLNDFGFEDALTDKGRFGEYVNDFSVYLVEDDYAALEGCAHFLATKDRS
jgi:glucokinase